MEVGEFGVRKDGTLSFVLMQGISSILRRREGKRSFPQKFFASFKKGSAACGRVSFLGGRKGREKRNQKTAGGPRGAEVMGRPMTYPRSPPGPPRVVERACTGAYPRTLEQIPPAGRLSCVVRPSSRPRLPGAPFFAAFALPFYSKYPPGCFLDEYFCHQNLEAQAAPVLRIGKGKYGGLSFVLACGEETKF